jgi:acyl-CoA synthetase (AMP-forming)/AMP-acid ligase II
VDVAELKRFAREHLAPFKLPRSFEIRTQVPRSPTGKILRRELQAEVRGSRSAPSRSPATESEAVDGETGDALRSKLE